MKAGTAVLPAHAWPERSWGPAQTGKGLAAPPPFTLADIKAAIPAHCFVKDAWRSMAYLARDVAVVFGLAAGAYAVNSWCACPAFASPLSCAAPWCRSSFSMRSLWMAAVRLLQYREG